MDAMSLLLACVATSALLLSVCFAQGDLAIQIDSHRQLFVDDHLIDKMSGATRVLHRPVRSDNLAERGGGRQTKTDGDGRAWCVRSSASTTPG